MVYLVSLFLHFIVVYSLPNYILTPISDINVNTYNLEILATIGKTTFYTSNHQNLMTFANTLTNDFIIEEDNEINLNFFNQQQVISNIKTPWHLDRINKKHLPLNNHYSYNFSGSCHTNPDLIIDTYVIDTGIDITHSQFNGRASWGANFVNSFDKDENGHGTHCSGLIGSLDYGVCKDARIIAVKVLDANGSGSISSVIKGLEWILNQHLSLKTHKSIISMSLGGSFSIMLNKAVSSCLEQSDFLYFVTASGNENSDTCNVSPASVNNVISVMATDINDNRAWFSNWGKCADIYSPGVNILSTTPNENTDIYSGTSMATPIVAGILNHYLNKYSNISFKELKKLLLLDSTKNIINGNKKYTKNNFVYLN